jgi:hypothetical protein
MKEEPMPEDTQDDYTTQILREAVDLPKLRQAIEQAPDGVPIGELTALHVMLEPEVYERRLEDDASGQGS